MESQSCGPHIAIVGSGPMCVYALERLTALLRSAPLAAPPRISVFERSGNFGAGEVNSDVQSMTSFMNRVTAQIGFAADEAANDVGPLLPPALRPTLHEWLQSKYQRLAEARFLLGPADIPRRALHGLALKEMFATFTRLLRDLEVRVDLYPAEVTDVSRAGSRQFHVHTAKEQQPLLVDRILFVTGNAHSFAGPSSPPPMSSQGPRTIARVYPLLGQLTAQTVPAGHIVGVSGLGLTAIDVFLHLTEGRGGHFEEMRAHPHSHGSRLQYVPSGAEPAKIVAFSPSGMLPCCRAFNQKLLDADKTYRGRFLTAMAIRQLRDSHGRAAVERPGLRRRQLDFDESILPLVVLETALHYYTTLLGPQFGEQLVGLVLPKYQSFLRGEMVRGMPATELLIEPLQAAFDQAAREFAARWPTGITGRALTDDGTIPALDAAFARVYFGSSVDSVTTSRSPYDHSPLLHEHRFDWQDLVAPLRRFSASCSSSWQAMLLEFMHRDLVAGRQGNVSNPIKAASDGVLRDLRSVFCEAVDHGGLTPQSHERFLNGFMRHSTRLCNGAGIEVTEKVLALAEHGILDLSIGPEPVVTAHADHYTVRGARTGVTRQVALLLDARIRAFDAANTEEPLYPNLLRRGLVRQWVNDDGVTTFCPGGLELSDKFHPVNAEGTEDVRLTFMGTPAEGQHFFSSAAARPHSSAGLFRSLWQWACESLDAPMGTFTR